MAEKSDITTSLRMVHWYYSRIVCTSTSLGNQAWPLATVAWNCCFSCNSQVILSYLRKGWQEHCLSMVTISSKLAVHYWGLSISEGVWNWTGFRLIRRRAFIWLFPEIWFRTGSPTLSQTSNSKSTIRKLQRKHKMVSFILYACHIEGIYTISNLLQSLWLHTS